MANKRGRTYEAPDMERAAQRFMKALVRRAESGEVEAIQALQRLAVFTDDALTNAIHDSHYGEAGFSLSYLQAETGLDRKTITRRLAKAR